MNRSHHTRRAITIGLAFMVFSILLTGCPPRKPTPIAADEEGEHKKLTRNVASVKEMLGESPASGRAPITAETPPSHP